MRRVRHSNFLCLIALAPALIGGCAMARGMDVAGPALAACRTTASPGGEAPLVRWVRPEEADDRTSLDAWCESVGPALVSLAPIAADQTPEDSVVIVSWNVNVGAGDIAGLVRDLRAGELTEGRPVSQFILLLQEAYRDGTHVPTELGAGARTAGRLQPRAHTGERADIATVAASLGLGLYYVPSMRNGQPHETREDRGNAILSTLPLTDLAAIELPFERQRRVAVEATVHGVRATGEAWSLRVTNAHLDNRAPAKRLWIFSTLARLRQARGLLMGMNDARAAVLGGDLNSWSGFSDAAYRAIAERLPIEATSDRRPTFAGLARLDHLLFRLPTGWRVTTRRLDRFGSDHNPLLAEIQIGN